MKSNPHLFDANGISLSSYDRLVAENERLTKLVDRLRRRLKAKGDTLDIPRESPETHLLH